jgi:CRISPR type IV-associated protein Csf3
MEPIQVTVLLSSPVGGAFDLPLDGILSAAWMRRERPDLYYSSQPPATVEELVEAELPLEKRGDGEQWYWSASFARWPASASDDRQFWNKRVDQKEIERVDMGKASQLNIGSGRYKAYHMPVPTRSALAIRWHCFGELAEIKGLLSSVFHFGKKRSQGMGAVREWCVEPVAFDYSCWRDDRPMRTIPFGEGLLTEKRQGFDLGFRTYRPPYWFSARQAVCLLADPKALVF